MIYDPIPDKRCKKCDQWFPRTHEFFYTAQSCRDKLHGSCKRCMAKEQYANADKAQAKARVKEFRRNNPERYKSYENPEKSRVAKQKYRERHPERVKESNQRTKIKHKDKARAYNKRYDAMHPESVKAKYQRRQARKRGLPDAFTSDDWKFALEYFSHSCAICSRPKGLWHTLAADHWIPLTSHDCPGTIPSNIIPLCQGENGCNNSKSNNLPLDWLTSRFGVRKARQILARINAYFEVVKGRK